MKKFLREAIIIVINDVLRGPDTIRFYHKNRADIRIKLTIKGLTSPRLTKHLDDLSDESILEDANLKYPTFFEKLFMSKESYEEIQRRNFVKYLRAWKKILELEVLNCPIKNVTDYHGDKVEFVPIEFEKMKLKESKEFKKEPEILLSN